MTHEIGDNLFILVRACTKETLELALAIAFRQHDKACSYSISKENGFVLSWRDPHPDASGFQACDWDLRKAVKHCWRWLEDLSDDGKAEEFMFEDAVRAAEDADSTAYGFEVHSVGVLETGFLGAFVGVRPAYIWISK